MCGIVGVIERNGEDLIGLVYFMLLWSQNRGQEAAGISLTDGKQVIKETWEGRVDRFDDDNLGRLVLDSGERASTAIGQVRYTNTGSNTKANFQPFTVSTKFGNIAVAHNGNLPNTTDLYNLLVCKGFEPDGTSDSELIARSIAYFSRFDEVNCIEDAIRAATVGLKGSFSLIVMTKTKLIGLRDPWGIRPLSFGQFNDQGYAFASETSAFDCLGIEWICDLGAGEMIIADHDGDYKKIQLLPKICEKMCMFEWIYFTFPGTVIFDRLVETARRHMGERLFYEHPVDCKNLDEWIVCATPNTGIPAGLGYAAASGIEYRRGLIKNDFVGRTFMQPSEHLRARMVDMKHMKLRREVNGKKIVLIDDSVVRGHSMRKLVPSLRKVGAKEIHVRITAPPYKHTCFLGTDTQRIHELIASRMTEEEICQYIGADSLGYLSLEGVINSIDPLPGYGFCTGCFDQNYPFSMEK
ncbi:MAG: amidophosphoribosyltransferase [Candidatus Berkelbacteria bacterium]